jgi:hypothetical protein
MNATTKFPLPGIPQVKELFGILFDGLAVKNGTKFDTSPKADRYFGVYVTNDGVPGAMCACDIAFAANSGAALSMLPPNAAKDAVKARELTEVMVAKRLVLTEASPHLRLDQVCAGTALPPAAVALLGAIKSRADFEIVLGKYGSGLFTVLLF